MLCMGLTRQGAHKWPEALALLQWLGDKADAVAYSACAGLK